MADLTAAEADGYIRAHLAHVGRTDTLFSSTPSASSTAAAPINRLSVTALLAACTENKIIADEQAARTAVAEETANATD